MTEGTTAAQCLRTAQATLLEAMAPKTEVRELTWSGGTTQALVLGQGPPLLLVHGGMGTAYQWAPILQDLAEHHTVYAPERPGCGLASSFEYDGVDVAAHAATFLEEILDLLELDAPTIVGNSMGGRWSMALASEKPERVEALVLLGAPAGTEGHPIPGSVRVMRYPLVRRLVARFIRGGDAKGSRDFHAKCLVARPEAQPEVYYEAMAADAAYNIDRWLPFVHRVVDLGGTVCDNLAINGPLKELTVPTTLVWGEHDAFAGPERGRQVASWLPDARFVEVAGAGHLPWLDAPDQVVDAILSASRDKRGGAAPGGPTP